MAIERKPEEESRGLALFDRFGGNSRLGKALSSIVTKRQRLEEQQVGIAEEIVETDEILEAVETVFRLQDELMEELQQAADTVLAAVSTVQAGVGTFQEKVEVARAQINDLLGVATEAPSS